MPSTILADNGVSSGSAGIKTSADSTGVLALQTTTAGGAATTAVTIDTSQNVGVGVTPSTWDSGQRAVDFGITGTLKSNTSTGSVVSLGNNCYYGSSAWRYKQSGQASALYDLRDTSEHRWYTSASGTAGNAITFTQAMTLDASGNLLVGTTTQRITEKLTVSSASTYVAYFDQQTNTSGYNVLGMTMQQNANNTSSYFLRAVTNNINIWYLYGNGTTSFTSDQRLKKNIETARNGYLEDLCQLRVVKYNWRNQEDDTPKELGLIAQEVEAVFPGLVQDADETFEDGITPKVLKGSVLPFMLLKAIQEQQALINNLTERLTALEGAQA